ncbi:MAG: hypothetical protein MZW92_56845 [Comamonadaceae bacterium]|nr:hypothetical protein [Comamonadaceae bacterium]
MLYLPPRWGHDGIAEGGDCMTCSVGLPRARRHRSWRATCCSALADEDRRRRPRCTATRAQPATATPGAIPPALAATSRGGRGAPRWPTRRRWTRALGESLTEPKPRVWFERRRSRRRRRRRACALDRARSRMLYDERHVFLNGEAYVAGGRDATPDAASWPTRAGWRRAELRAPERRRAAMAGRVDAPAAGCTGSAA